MLDKIPDGTAITFLDSENLKLEKQISKNTSKKYVKLKVLWSIVIPYSA